MVIDGVLYGLGSFAGGVLAAWLTGIPLTCNSLFYFRFVLHVLFPGSGPYGSARRRCRVARRRQGNGCKTGRLRD